MISVIIPVYNASKTLDRCMQALIDSEFPNNKYEIIVVDDCSTDRSLEIARTYTCKTFSTPQNSGAAVARNYGSMQAAGDILFFIDSDVLVEPDVLKKIDEKFSKSPHIDAIVGAYRSRQPNNDFFSLYQTAFTFYNHEQCAEGQIFWFWGACGSIKREVFEKIGRFDEKYSGAGAEDIELGYDLSNQGYTIELDKSISVVHSHKHTFSSIIRNNLKKSSEWCTLFLTKNKANKYKHGFTSFRNGFSIILTWITFLFLILYFAEFNTLFWVSLSLSGLLIINFRYYRFMYNEFGKCFLIKGIFFHWLTYFFIGAGIIIGIYKYFFKFNANIAEE
ncbi:MAG: hypothetical protein A2161_11020 [Candidatus Schekmanbacteria bacterium RBG_13_48_7]|uniref:Glycosyltransferase 2-like domain-containing protein n=1 Tax=Candidatus Schekmanbacteria bacterium RBG_13_48_7 TaxID=1817878 RepID=A0A1F7SAB2_9BACT|nr:MAG: hypothetical protein A2161_11020 [Candidatus Schekmanbacteria bacterium RBG_13_48_7]